MTLACGCPESFPDWDQQEIDLGGQPVHEQRFPTLLHMPLAYEHYVKQQYQAVTALELEEQWPGLTMTQTGLFGGRLLRLLHNPLSASHQVTRLPPSFQLYVRLHHGDIGTIKPTLRTLQQTLLDQGKLPKELLISHLSCPECEKQKGGEQLLLLRRWEKSPRLEKRVQRRTQ